jgi:hypothetical protein
MGKAYHVPRFGGACVLAHIVTVFIHSQRFLSKVQYELDL